MLTTNTTMHHPTVTAPHPSVNIYSFYRENTKQSTSRTSSHF
jgi:hypothetical protein